MRRSLSLAARLLGLVTAIAAIGLGLASPAQAIANGTPVPEGHYRFSVKLTMTNIPRPDGSHYNSACSAALISARWIITAGHCFHDVYRNPVSGVVPYATTATVGRADVSGTTGHVVDVVWVQQSPTNDIALAELATPVTDVAPLALATKAPKVDQVLRITGWGASDDVNPVPGTHLQTGQVKVSSFTATTVGVRGYRPLPTTSACVYDSGAPYFLEREHQAPVLVSVESFGPDCPHDQEETTSRVDTITTWIHRITG
jgi:secreted trypsin-like serine protease